ncbi:DUF2461 domain-containing protein [Sphingobacterium humi]|uniref:TIGR02453 family protein n=1 Tax=Sphingobacterium humi TaxID=1796905 RepID=A0A6N8L284_9SPHI|nr:DUF2461 domain-containing protein [Sphingobacterium humi]MVZ63204.1 TIGR02453 family protein [Sphingobacterium humi]
MNIAPATFDFLAQLKENNNREWFQANKPAYEAALNDVLQFIEGIIKRLSEVDPHINEEIQAKKCLFRIYRDVRFSKNKDPYKSWFAAGISVDGRKLAGPEYYIHIEPEGTFLAVGYWRPEKQHLEAIRQEIDYSSAELFKALEKGGWKAENLSQEDKLSRPPAGYGADHEHIDLLKHRSFILQKNLSRKEMESPKALDRVIAAYESMIPFKQFIHMALDQ